MAVCQVEVEWVSLLEVDIAASLPPDLARFSDVTPELMLKSPAPLFTPDPLVDFTPSAPPLSLSSEFSVTGAIFSGHISALLQLLLRSAVVDFLESLRALASATN